MSLTAKDILLQLVESHPQYIAIPSLAMGTGFANRRIDLFVIHPWPSKGGLRKAFEIKISRGDFLRELKDHGKYKEAVWFANYFYYVAPVGVIKPEELPLDTGLIEVDELRYPGHLWLSHKVEAIRRDNAPSWELVASLLRSKHILGDDLVPDKTLGLKEEA